MAEWGNECRPSRRGGLKFVAFWLIVGALIGFTLAGALPRRRLWRSEGRLGARVVDAETRARPAHHALGDTLAAGRRNAIVRAVEAAEPAVVSVSVVALRHYAVRSPFSLFDDPFFAPFFWGPGREYVRKVTNMGSGFIVNPDGHILTNEHVVAGAEEIAVTLSDGRELEAQLLSADVAQDVAVLKIEGEDLPTVILGDSDDVILGEWAIAIGNPFGYLISDARPTVTVGVISALDRDFEPQRGTGRVYRGMIQTDAAINPGNSGGPLLNSLGEVIGINTFIFSESGGSLGIGFALPISRAVRTLDELLTYGHLRTPWTGLTVQRVDRLIARSLGLPRTMGVIVAEVASQSPGQAAGVRVGDVILAVDGRDIRDSDEIRQAFRGASVGDEYTLTVWRDGEALSLQMQLTPRPEER